MNCKWWDIQNLSQFYVDDYSETVPQFVGAVFLLIGEPLPVITSEKLCLSMILEDAFYTQSH